MIIRKFIRAILFIIMFLFCSTGVYAQLNIHSVGADLGIINNVEYNADFIGSDPILFPEVYLSGRFFESYLNWRVNFGYWDEAASQPKYSDRANYSYSSFVATTEMIYLTPSSNPNHPAPFRIIAGLSYHYISAADLTNYASDIHKKDYADNLFYFNTGLELHLFIQRELSLFTKGIIYLLLNNSDEHLYNSSRLQVSLGVNYRFGKL